MTTINLKDFYSWYTHDEYIEVSDEVAAEQIPKDARCRFITGDGTVFQGFLFDDRQL